MLAQDFLTLKLVRLNSAEAWSYQQDGLCVLLAKAGTGHCAFGATVQALAAGDVLVLQGAAAVRLAAAPAAELIFSSFSLRLEHLYPLFASAEISLLETVSDSLRQPRHLPAVLPLAKHCHRLVEEITPQANLDHRSQLLRVISLILTDEFNAGHERRAGDLGIEEHLLQIFERLSADELLTISVGDLATKFSCSRRHLNRLFHQYFGFSVASLRMEMRLLKSVSLLRDANTKIISVAEQCGFNHLGLFNTCFKRRFGVSPGQWRKGVGQAETAPAGGLTVSGATGPMHFKGLCPMPGASSSLLHGGAAVAALLPAQVPRSAGESAAPNPLAPARALPLPSPGGRAKLKRQR